MASERDSRSEDLESTSDLLLRARGGDVEAQNRLFERARPRLRRWARGRLPQWSRDAIDTDDLVQETLLRTLGNLSSFEPFHEGAFQAYLRQSLLNRVRNVVRDAGRRSSSGMHHAAEIDPSPSPLERAIGRETVERYEAALQKVHREDREAIVLRIEMDYSYPEIAQALGKPSADAARMAVARALMKMAEEMRREER